MIISYCLNPCCPKPKNHAQLKYCHTCGWSLIIHDRYRAIKRIGKGGFSNTFVGVDLKTLGNSLCLIKQISLDLDKLDKAQMSLDLFKREAKTLKKIDHDQIPKLLNYFYENQQLYLIQELIKGKNLRQEVKGNGVFVGFGVKRFLAEMLSILQYIHSQKVIHRDIKPANILRRQKDGKLVLIDFGIVKDRVNSHSAKTYGQTAFTNFSVGTTGFAPPEQLALRPVYASDIYALGVTCVYLLTGKSPKLFDCDVKTGRLLWEKEVLVNPSLTKVLNKMLDLDLDRRYRVAAEVIKDLDILPLEHSLTSRITTTPKLQQAIAQRKNGKKRSNIPIKWDLQTFLAAYRNGKKDFSKQNLNYLKLEKFELSQFIFCYSQLEGTVLREANLSQANFYGANLSTAILSKANLQKTCLSTSDLQNADLQGANLTNANLINSNLQAANLRGANLKHARIESQQLNQAKTNWATIYPDGRRRWWKLLSIFLSIAKRCCLTAVI